MLWWLLLLCELFGTNIFYWYLLSFRASTQLLGTHLYAKNLILVLSLVVAGSKLNGFAVLDTLRLISETLCTTV